jgi:hypothetical protein
MSTRKIRRALKGFGENRRPRRRAGLDDASGIALARAPRGSAIFASNRDPWDFFSCLLDRDSSIG